jgi:hypothetical protein
MLPIEARGRGPAAAAALAVLLAACAPRGEQAPEPAAPDPPKAAAVGVPAPEVLDRAELLVAVGSAAAAFAAGAPPPQQAAALEGRRFALKLPFGCGWPQTEAGRTGYRLDPVRGTLKVTVAAEDLSKTPWAALLADGREVEAVEGFWIRRPWMAAEACPAVAARPGGAPSPEVVGLAEVFVAGGSRVLRRGARAYEVTRRHPGDRPPPAGGFRVAVEGRIAQAGGRPIRCSADHPDQRPVCLALVEFDRVAIEDAAGETLGAWTR